ncbi:unnamed protein product [Closterium sp. Naga37s-1]|nr:unnamed protein product [Closterium sp. Naga37s-1]
MRRARRTLASSTWRSIRSWQRWSSSTTTARVSGGYARLHGARKPFRVHSDDPRKRHLHGEGVGVGDEEADDGTLEGSELAGFEEERARYREEGARMMRCEGELDGQHHVFTQGDLRHDHLSLSFPAASPLLALHSTPNDIFPHPFPILPPHFYQLATWLLVVERTASRHRMRREMKAANGDGDGR